MPAPTGSAPIKSAPPVLLRDLLLACSLPVLAPFAWLASDRARYAAAEFLSATVPRLRPGAARRNEERLSSVFDVRDRAALCRAVRTITYYELLQLLSLHAPGRRPPRASLEGYGFLEEAYAAGNGAILWVAPTAFGPTMTKAALKSAGVALWHLSRPTHGFSSSAFGQAVLNPIRITAENRFLAHRIVLQPGRARAALEEITDCLRQNRAVSITIGTEAKDLRTIPFASGTMTVATRPIDLARRTGAALLPVVTLRDRDGKFVTEIGPSLVASDGTDEQAVAALAAFLESRVRRSPEQFAHSPVFWPSQPKSSRTAPAAPPSLSRPSLPPYR